MHKFDNDMLTLHETIVDMGGPFPGCIPIQPVHDLVLFPFSLAPIPLGRDSSLFKVLQDQRNFPNRLVGILARRDASKDSPEGDGLFSIGTLASVIKELRLKDESRFLFVQGLKRFRVSRFLQLTPYAVAQVEYLSDVVPEGQTPEAIAELRRSIEILFQKLVSLSPGLPEDLVTIVLNIEEVSFMADFIASILPSQSVPAKQDLLETLDVWVRLGRIQAELKRLIDILEVKGKIESQVQTAVNKSQREYYLREQLKAIHKELGETEGSVGEVETIRRAIDEAGLSEEAMTEANGQIKRLAYLSPASPEFAVVKTYLDYLVSLPWQNCPKATLISGMQLRFWIETTMGWKKSRSAFLNTSRS